MNDSNIFTMFESDIIAEELLIKECNKIKVCMELFDTLCSDEKGPEYMIKFISFLNKYRKVQQPKLLFDITSVIIRKCVYDNNESVLSLPLPSLICVQVIRAGREK